MTTVYSAPAIIGLDQVLDVELTIQGQRVVKMSVSSWVEGRFKSGRGY